MTTIKLLTFETASGSHYTIDVGEGTLHRHNAKPLRGADGEIIPGSGWKLDACGLITPVGFLPFHPDVKIASATPQGGMFPVVGLDRPIITTPITQMEAHD